MHMRKFKINVMALVALAVAGVTGVTLTSAGLSKKSSTPWIEVTTNSSSDPNQDQLGDEISDPTTGSGPCVLTVKPQRCAVQFNNPNDHDLTDMTVEEALQQSGVSIAKKAYRP